MRSFEYLTYLREGMYNALASIFYYSNGGVSVARRTREEARETREKLLESALDIMSAKPFATVSMNEIAEKVGLSKGAVYWHFKNKNDVLITLIESLGLYIEEEMEKDSRNLAMFDDIRLYFKKRMEKSLHLDPRFKKLNMLMERRQEWSEDVREKVMAILSGTLNHERVMLENLIIKSQKEGTIRSDISSEELSSLFGAIFHGFFIFQINELYSLNFTKYTDFIFDAFAKELKPETQKEKVL